MFEAFWREGLLACDALRGIAWIWLALDGATGGAPLGGGKTGPDPTDQGKPGVKRSLLADGCGVPLGAATDGANRNGHKLMRATVEAVPVERPGPTRRRPQHPCLDKGFDYAEPRALAAGSPLPCTCARAARRPGPSAMPGPRRAAGWWSAHSWLNRFRAILVRWNKNLANYLAMLRLALAAITWRQALPE